MAVAAYHRPEDSRKGEQKRSGNPMKRYVIYLADNMQDPSIKIQLFAIWLTVTSSLLAAGFWAGSTSNDISSHKEETRKHGVLPAHIPMIADAAEMKTNSAAAREARKEMRSDIKDIKRFLNDWAKTARRLEDGK